MPPDLLLCTAPVMSVVRPSIGLALLQAAVEARGHLVETLYLNLDFAEACGLDLNEQLAERTPAELLVGDWIFRPGVGPGGSAEAQAAHDRAIATLCARRGIPDLHPLRDTLAPGFVAAAARRIAERAPAILGFSTMFQQTMASLAIARAVKALDPRIVIVFGGANCQGPMGRALLRNYPQIDHVFTGEADFSFPQWVDHVLDGAISGQAVRGIDGDTGGIGALSDPATGEPAPVVALDATPIPEYRDYFAQIARLSDRARIEVSLPFEASRGCWWGQKHHCTFCGLNAGGMAFRAKSGGRVVTEIATLYARHGVSRLAATDNILGQRHLDTVMGPLAELPEPRPALFFEVKANLDERQMRRLAEAGVTHVQPGIESLSDAVLRIMRKGVGTLHNLRFLRNCRELGLAVTWSILHGFPDEPAEAYRDMAALVPALTHLPPPTGLSAVRLDRFSPNFEQAAAMGFTGVVPAPAYAALHALPEEELRALAYFFEGEARGAAPEAAIAPLRTAVAAWRDGWAGGAPAQLGFARLGSDAGMLVRDTRAIAGEVPYHYLDPAAAALIDALREPRAIDAAIDRALAARGGGAEGRTALLRAFDQLLATRLVVVIDGVALALPIDTAAARPGTRQSPLGALAAPMPATEARVP